jgi:transcriptional regulator with XRE-family HTH domain
MGKKPLQRRPRPKPRYSIHYLRQWRERQRMDRKDLAEATGLAVQTVGRIENRLIQLTQETIDAFAKVLRISRGALFRPPPPPNNNSAR